VAINKKQASTWVKIVVVVVVIAFAGGSLLPVFFGAGRSAQQPVTDTETAATMERIASDHIPSIMGGIATLESEPESYTVLVNLGNTYYSWGAQLRDAFGPGGGQDLPMWTSAGAYYERALSLQPGDPNVKTDLAVTYFYGGQTQRAIDLIEEVIAESPDFAPAHFNAGIFYRASGQFDDAVAILERYLELEPEGPNTAAARQILSDIDSAPPAVEDTIEDTQPPAQP